MKKGKIIGKFKDKCLNCRKPMIRIERKCNIRGCKNQNITVANFYCSKKCEKEFKIKLDKSMIFNDGYEEAEKNILKKMHDEIRWIKNHMKEIRHPNNGYHQGSIDILEILIKSIKNRSYASSLEVENALKEMRVL